VHVYDGTAFLAKTNFEQSGDFSNKFVTHDPDSFSLGNVHKFPNPRPQVHFGIGLSLNVISLRANARFFVSSAGADFVV
jgi:hypothetical protein